MTTSEIDFEKIAKEIANKIEAFAWDDDNKFLQKSVPLISDVIAQAYKQGQASVLAKFPSKPAAHKAMIAEEYASKYCDITIFDYAWFKCYAWLKSQLEKADR